MEDLKRMAIFSAVVDAKSFSGAARRIGIAKSAVSKHVNLLESHIGVRLLNRTTRKLSLTDAGELYYQGCKQMVNVANDANRKVRRLQDQAVGTLRLSSTVAFGTKHLAPILSKFHQQYPELKVELLLGDEIVNMIDEGIDLSIRIGWLSDSSMVARKLFSASRLIVATPEYLERHGTPMTPTELVNHNWIIVTLLPSPQRCTFKLNGQQQTVHMMSTTRTNSIDASLALVLSGDGITSISQYLIEDELASGKLIQLLPQYEPDQVGVFAIYPDRQYVPSKVRLLLNSLIEYGEQWVVRNVEK